MREQALEILKKGSMLVRFKPNDPAVRVPDWLAKQKSLALEFGYNTPIPIKDLLVTSLGISGTLTFVGFGTFWCYVPWSAVTDIVERKQQPAASPERRLKSGKLIPSYLSVVK